MSFSYSDLISEYESTIKAYELRVAELRALFSDSDIVWNKKSFRRLQRRINSLNSSIESMNFAIVEMLKYT